jgi:hypothetical protein
MSYFFNLDMEIVSADTRQINMIFSTVAGAPVDISTWTFYYKAVNKVTSGTTITVANASMTQSNSGRGVTDKITIPLDNSVTAVAAGKYDHEVAVKISSEPVTIAKGILTVVARVTSTA